MGQPLQTATVTSMRPSILFCEYESHHIAVEYNAMLLIRRIFQTPGQKLEGTEEINRLALRQHKCHLNGRKESATTGQPPPLSTSTCERTSRSQRLRRIKEKQTHPGI